MAENQSLENRSGGHSDPATSAQAHIMMRGLLVVLAFVPSTFAFAPASVQPLKLSQAGRARAISPAMNGDPVL